MALIGVSANFIGVLDAALGAKVPVVRDYGWLDHIPAGWAALAVGRQLDVSVKFRTNAGGASKATDVTAGKWDVNVIAFADLLATFPVSPYDKHTLIFEHEAEGHAAAMSGTPAELCAAMLHCAKLARGRPGFSAKAQIGVCLVGWDLSKFPDFDAALKDADIIIIDEPYHTGSDATTGASIGSPRLAYITKNYPGKPIGIGEWGAEPFAGRTKWINDTVAWMQTEPMLKMATYWDATVAGGDDFHVTATADQAALMAAIKASLIKVLPPPPPVIPMKSITVSALNALASARLAHSNAGQALTAAQAAFDATGAALDKAVAAITS